MRVLLLVLVAACWRGGPTTDGQEPRSFVARVTALGELQRGTEAVHAELATALHRILHLATEQQRTAIRDDLRALAHELAQLSARARAARASGDDAAVIARVEHRLAHAAVTLGKLREGLRHAKTLAELEAVEPARDESVEPFGPWHVDVVMFSGPDLATRWRRGVVDLPP